MGTQPGHPNLLATYLDNTLPEAYAEKPMYGREGSNVRLVWNEEVLREHPGEWGNDKKVYQDLCPLVRLLVSLTEAYKRL